MSFRCSGSQENVGVRLLVITHREIPKYEIRKRSSVGKPWCFGVLETEKPKGQSSCTRQSRNPDG
jgi:hypothetical protein